MLWSFRTLEDPASPIDSFGFPDIVAVHPNSFEAIFEPRVSEDMLQLCAADALGYRGLYVACHQ